MPTVEEVIKNRFSIKKLRQLFSAIKAPLISERVDPPAMPAIVEPAAKKKRAKKKVS